MATKRKKGDISIENQLSYLAPDQVMHPELKAEFLSALPAPDLEVYKKQLQSLKSEYLKAFPWDKYGKGNDDSYAYNRVKGPLGKFKTALTKIAKKLKEAGMWKSLLDYTFIALDYADDLPEWKDAKNNTEKNRSVKTILKNLPLTEEELNSLKEKLVKYEAVKDIFIGQIDEQIASLNKTPKTKKAKAK